MCKRKKDSPLRFGMTSVCFRNVSLGLALSLLIFFSVPSALPADENSRSQDDQDEISFYELEQSFMNMKMTTAGKKAEKVSDIPASVVVITRRDIETYGYQTLTDVLRSIPGLYAIDDYAEGGVMFGVRGFWSGVPNANLIIMINSVPQTKNLFASHPMTGIPVNVEAIDRIEVVRGPLSVVYGNGAFYGAINIITDGSVTGESDNSEEKDLLSVSYGSGNTKRASLKLSSVKQDFKFALNASLYDTYGIDQSFSEMASGIQDSGKTGGRLEEKSKFLNLSAEYKKFYSKLVLVKTDDETEFDAPAVDDGTQMDINDYNFCLGYKNNFTEKFSIDARAIAYKDRNTFKYSVLFDNFFGVQQVEADAYEFSIDAFYKYSPSAQFSSGLFYKTITDVYNFYDLPSFGAERLEHNLFSLHKDDNIDTRAFYFSADVSPFSNFLIVAGFRLEQPLKYRLEKLHYEDGSSSVTEAEQNLEDVEFIPRLAGIYHINENNTVKLLYGKAINRPSFFQNYSNLFRPDHVDLSSEFIETVELNYISVIQSKYSVSLSLFNNRLNNLITRVPYHDENNVYLGSRNENAGEMVTNGLELSVQAEPVKDLRFDASVTYQKTEDSREGFEDIYPAYSPKLLAYIKASYRFMKNYTVAFSGQYTDEMETYWDESPENPDSTAPVGRIGEKVDGYFVLDANFRADNLFDTGMFASLRCSNLLDAEVRYPAFTNTPWLDKGTLGYGRMFMFTLGYKF